MKCWTRKRKDNTTYVNCERQAARQMAKKRVTPQVPRPEAATNRRRAVPAPQRAVRTNQLRVADAVFTRTRSRTRKGY
jgi:hypothetical protein